MGLGTKKKEEVKVVKEVTKEKKKIVVPISCEEWFRELKNKEVEIEGVKFIVTKAEGCKVELTRKDYK